MNTSLHQSVLLTETIAGLTPAPGRSYIDGTLGAGGHTAAILASGGRVLGFDRDPQALALARKRLTEFADRVVIVHASYAQMSEIAPAHGFGEVDGILLDLGVSSMQLDDAARGFSFRQDAPLDMRFDPTGGQSAAEVVNTLPQSDLADILFRYGEERYSRRVAAAILRARPILSTTRLAEVVASAIPGAGRERIHPATRSFQGLRIFVNGELAALEQVLPQALSLLKPGGRLAVISFHSLEDRIVKQFIKRESSDCICEPRGPICICGHIASLRMVTRKPIEAEEAEVAINPRARSARLRVAEKV